MNMVEIAGKCLITIGIIFDLFGCIGLVRLPDLYNRLQAATKCVTLGTCSILIGNLVIAGFNAIGIKALLCAIFILITSPTSAHALARASYIAGVKLWEGSIIDKLKEDIEAGKKE
jgi:multicomponent Na+:H+ antiporter subunit G